MAGVRLLASALVLACSAAAGLNFGLATVQHNRYMIRDAANSTVRTANISMPIDHFNASDTRTFNNRYYFEDKFYKPGGPIFIYDAGEATADIIEADNIFTEGVLSFSPPLELAKAHSGLLIYWEHRYYGESQPCPRSTGYLVNVDPACSYQYLTMDQALEDVVYFAHHPNFEGYPAGQLANMTASQTPWIFIGASYPGSRAAWLRVRNPETIFASWASSAVVQPTVDGSSYYNTQLRSQPSNCTADINAAMKYIDSSLSSENASVVQNMTERLQRTRAASYGNYDNSTFWANKGVPELADFLVTTVSDVFQILGPGNTSDIVCDHFERFNASATPEDADSRTVFQNPGDGVPSAGGLVGSGVSPKAIANAYMYALVKWNTERHRRYFSYSDPTTSPGFNYDWQVITQFGVIEAWTEDYQRIWGNRSILSSHYNYTYARASTIAEFPGVDPGLIPAEPDVGACTKYGGWDMTPSNTMFTAGEFDCWRPYTPLSIDEEIGAPMRKATQEVPKCDTPPQGTNVFGLVYPDTGHGQDGPIYPGGKDGPDVAARVGFQLFDKALREWLPCFKPNSTKV